MRSMVEGAHTNAPSTALRAVPLPRVAGQDDARLTGEKMQTPLTIIGTVLLIMGLVFIGQGSGYFPYPASSFMIKETRWIYYGGAIAVVGLLVIVFSRR
jgi:hypothetical protein